MGPSLHKTSISDSFVYSCRTKTILTSFRKNKIKNKEKHKMGTKERGIAKFVTHQVLMASIKCF